MPEPRPRTPAQIEALRRNGARSKGPTTPEGKAKASRNALKHGLTATHHLVLEDEVPDDLDDLIATITEETGAAGEIEARLARRLAIAFWKGERAERIETALFDAAPKLRPPQHGFEWEEVDPLTTFDLRRFNAIRGQQAPIGREIVRCLKELRQLRKDALPVGTDEPEPVPENEPKDAPPPPANDDAAHALAPPADTASRNEPEDPWDVLPLPVRTELEGLLARDDWEGLARLGATGALAPLDMVLADTALPEALSRFLSCAMRATAAA